MPTPREDLHRGVSSQMAPPVQMEIRGDPNQWGSPPRTSWYTKTQKTPDHSSLRVPIASSAPGNWWFWALLVITQIGLVSTVAAATYLVIDKHYQISSPPGISLWLVISLAVWLLSFLAAAALWAESRGRLSSIKKRLGLHEASLFDRPSHQPAFNTQNGPWIKIGNDHRVVQDVHGPSNRSTVDRSTSHDSNLTSNSIDLNNSNGGHTCIELNPLKVLNSTQSFLPCQKILPDIAPRRANTTPLPLSFQGESSTARSAPAAVGLRFETKVYNESPLVRVIKQMNPEETFVVAGDDQL